MPACKILVIEDDEDLRESLIALFESEGHETQGAATGLAALTTMTWARFRPDVILLDLRLPAMSGGQFLEVLQKHPEWSRIPILVCSGDRVPDIVARSVFGVLQKPFDLQVMLSLVLDACRSRLPA